MIQRLKAVHTAQAVWVVFTPSSTRAMLVSVSRDYVVIKLPMSGLVFRALWEDVQFP